MFVYEPLKDGDIFELVKQQLILRNFTPQVMQSLQQLRKFEVIYDKRKIRYWMEIFNIR